MEAGDLELAGEIAMAGLMAAFAKMIVFFEQEWAGFKGFFVDGWHDAVKLLKIAGSDLGAFMQTVMIDIGQAIRRNVGEATVGVLKEIIDKYISVMDTLNVGGINDAQIIAARALQEGLSLSLSDAAAAQRKAEQDRRDRLNAIEKEAAAAQEARDAARKADIAAAQDDANVLQQELERLRKNAAWNKIPWLEIPEDRIRKAAAQITGVSGQFGGANAAQAFGFGDKSVQQKQLSALEKGNDLLGQIKQEIQGLDGVAFA